MLLAGIIAALAGGQVGLMAQAPAKHTLSAPQVDLDVRKAELLGPLRKSLGSQPGMVKIAIAAEQAGDYPNALRSWMRIEAELQKENRAADFTNEEAEDINKRRKAIPTPELIWLDIARVLIRLEAYDEAEKSLTKFIYAAESRRQRSVSGDPSYLHSLPDQEEVVEKTIRDAVRLAGTLQANEAAKCKAWPTIRVIESREVQTKELGRVVVKIISPTARRKEEQGVKRLAVYVGAAKEPTYAIKMDSRAIVWDLGYIKSPKERAAIRAKGMIRLTASKSGTSVGVTICFHPNSGNYCDYQIYREGVAFIWGGD